MSDIGAHVVKLVASLVVLVALGAIGALPSVALSTLGAPRWLSFGAMLLLPMIVVCGYLLAKRSMTIGRYLYDLPRPYKY